MNSWKEKLLKELEPDSNNSTSKLIKGIKSLGVNSPRLDSFFQHGDRITIKIPSDCYQSSNDSSNIRNIKLILERIGYKLHDYNLGLCSKDNRIFKIVKVINRISPNNDLELSKYFIDDTLKNFINDPMRSNNKKEMYITISRNPYDVITMSTFKGWTSCMSLKNGSNKHRLEYDLKYGTIICYIHSSKEFNIEKTSGRFLLKPYYSTNNKSLIYYENEKSVYGTIGNIDISNLGNYVKNMINEQLFINDKEIFKTYDDLYIDSLSRTFVYRNTEWDFNNLEDVKLYNRKFIKSIDHLKVLLSNVENIEILFHSKNCELALEYKVLLESDIITEKTIKYIHDNFDILNVLESIDNGNGIQTNEINLILKYLPKSDIESFCSKILLHPGRSFKNLQFLTNNKIPNHIKRIIYLNNSDFDQLEELSKSEYKFIVKNKLINKIKNRSKLDYLYHYYVIKNNKNKFRYDLLRYYDINMLKVIEKATSCIDMEIFLNSIELCGYFGPTDEILIFLGKYSYIPNIRIIFEEYRSRVLSLFYTVEPKPIESKIKKAIHKFKYQTFLKHFFK